MGLCCAVEERGETPGREDSPTDLGETELDPGGEAKCGEDKAFGKTSVVFSFIRVSDSILSDKVVLLLQVSRLRLKRLHM